MITVNSQGGEERWGINPAIKRHYELEIETLQNEPRDEDKLRQLLKLNEKQNEQATQIEDTHRLVTEIENTKACIVFGVQKAAIAAESRLSS